MLRGIRAREFNNYLQLEKLSGASQRAFTMCLVFWNGDRFRSFIYKIKLCNNLTVSFVYWIFRIHMFNKHGRGLVVTAQTFSTLSFFGNQLAEFDGKFHYWISQKKIE